MKIYTRTGDKGETSLLGGQRVPKDHERIEAYGTVDELNAHLGLLKDQAPERFTGPITTVQNELFAIGSTLASSADTDPSKFKVPQLEQTSIDRLEQWMDKWERDLPPMHNFILPGGNAAVSQAHVTRCVCRRAERRVVHLAGNEPVPPLVINYLNRLSDLLFVLSRAIGNDLNVPEQPWKPNG